MKILKTDNAAPDEHVINEAIDVLANGGVIIYPTDTVYGLGANIFNNRAVRNVFGIKQRNLLLISKIIQIHFCLLNNLKHIFWKQSM